MTLLDEYTTRVEGKIDSRFFLGRLFWYAISELRLPHADAVTGFQAAGIATLPPADPKDDDVFLRVCSAVKRKKVPTANPDVFDDWRMKELKDTATITKRVLRDRVNNTGRKIAFDECFDIIFDRETCDLVFKPLPGYKWDKTGRSIQHEIIEQYYMWRNCLNAYAIREWIRSYIMDHGSTRVRPGGGVYFLREAHLPVIDSLETLGLWLADYNVDKHGKVEFHSLPLLDDLKQREMVQKAFEAETVDAVDTLVGEIGDILGGDKKITVDRFDRLVTDFQDLHERTTEYEELLESKLASASSRLSIFQQSLMQLRKTHVKDAT